MIYFLIYLLVEVLISVEISSQIGGLNTFLEIMLTAIAGFLLIRNLKETLLFNIAEFMAGGITVSQLKSRNVFPFAGAILLILPGFFTDIIGLLFQFSFITDLLPLGNRDDRTSEDIRKRDFETNYQDDNIIDMDFDDNGKEIKR
jgi:UPF0716 family protein affecting phage T7 exclusion